MEKVQCAIITAYKNAEELCDLLTAIHTYIHCFVHLDKKTSFKFENIRSQFPDVHFYSIFHIHWGGYEHLNAICYLMNEAVTMSGWQYVHIISGEDYPLIPCSEMMMRLAKNNKIFCDYSLATAKKHPANRRYRYKWLYTKFSQDYKNSMVRMINLIFVGIQVLLPFLQSREIGNLTKVYWGFVWGTYPRDAVIYILEYLKSNPTYLKDLRWCKIPEELCFQTILMNSEFKDRMENNNLRFWNMEGGDNSGPVYLDMEDLKKLEKSNAFYARKVKSGTNISIYLKSRLRDCT